MSNDSLDTSGMRVKPVPSDIDNDIRLSEMNSEKVDLKALNKTDQLMPDKADLKAKDTMIPIPDRKEDNAELPNQQEPDKSTDKPKLYIRLLLHLEKDKVSIVDVRAVEGPLIISKQIYGSLVYEVRLDSRRIMLGSIPDQDEYRSFPNIKGPPEEQGHFFWKMESHDITIRIPKADLSASTLPKLQIKIYRIKSEISQPIGDKNLGDQFSNELNELWVLDGIKIEQLPKDFQEEFTKFLDQ